jgi:hypothetical protein
MVFEFDRAPSGRIKIQAHIKRAHTTSSRLLAVEGTAEVFREEFIYGGVSGMNGQNLKGGD